MAKKKTFVLYPSLGVGHLIHTVELAKHLATASPCSSPSSTRPTPTRCPASRRRNPAISFRLLPAPASPDVAAHPAKRSHNTLRLANPTMRDLLHSLPSAAVADTLDVAAELGVPAYFFFASAAGDLACFLNLPYLYPTLPHTGKLREAPCPLDLRRRTPWGPPLTGAVPPPSRRRLVTGQREKRAGERRRDRFDSLGGLRPKDKVRGYFRPKEKN
ncbi:unnamed protein product [Urochloa humidicola]